jgi:hypothetical protein
MDSEKRMNFNNRPIPARIPLLNSVLRLNLLLTGEMKL